MKPSLPDPFVLSRNFAIDPAYSTRTCVPSRDGLSLWSRKTTGPCWLYTPGSLEAWLFERTRREAFSTCLNVWHPGRFRERRSILYARFTFVAKRSIGKASCTLYANGSTHVVINGRTALHTDCAVRPRPHTLNLRSFLRRGTNAVTVRVMTHEGPPTLLLDSAQLQTDGRWEVSEDDCRWVAPRRLPFEGDHCFPHDERLPEHRIPLVKQDDGLYDAGVQVLGRPVVRLKARSRGSVTVYPGESRAEARSNALAAREQVVPTLSFADRATADADQPLAFRCLRLSTARTAPVTDVAAALPLYPTQQRGAFACADQKLTQIWMHAAYTLRACMQLVFVDGLKRDRLPWAGDLYACGLGNYVSFGEQRAAEYSMLALMSDEPDESDINGTITYSLFWILAVRDYVMHTGDTAILAWVLPHCDRLIQSVDKRTGPDGLLDSAAFKWIYIDWANVQTRGRSAFVHFLLVMALDAAAQIGALAGRQDSSTLSRRADTLRKKCRTLFWSSSRGAFVDSVEHGQLGAHISRQCNAFAVLSGVCDKPRRAAVLRNVLLNSAVAPVGTPYMKLFEARALAACGHTEAMLAVVRQYWGEMLDAGASTFWEAHDSSLIGDSRYAFYGRPFAKSLCHAWSSGPLYLLSSELFGLRPLKPGWAEFTVAATHESLGWACAEVPTPHGPIRVSVSGGAASVRFPKGTVLVTPDGTRMPAGNGPRCVTGV